MKINYYLVIAITLIGHCCAQGQFINRTIHQDTASTDGYNKFIPFRYDNHIGGLFYTMKPNFNYFNLFFNSGIANNKSTFASGQVFTQRYYLMNSRDPVSGKKNIELAIKHTSPKVIRYMLRPNRPLYLDNRTLDRGRPKAPYYMQENHINYSHE